MARLKITRRCAFCNSVLKRTNVMHCSRKCQFQHWNATVPVRFWLRVRKTKTCWLWTGLVNEWGYGMWGVKHWPRSAHRMSWQITHGPIPKGLKVLHHCDNPPCVRPDHLFLGTDKDNHDDMVRKGRRREHYGSEHGMSRLTESIVISMRDLRASQRLSYQKIADMFHVDKATAHRAIIGQSWKHLPLPKRDG